MTGAGDDGLVPTEERWPECSEGVREAGEGEAALLLLAVRQRLCSMDISITYSRRRKRDGLKGKVFHALGLIAGLLQRRRQIA